MDVRTFLWYLTEKVRGIEKLRLGNFQMLRCRFCYRKSEKGLRVLKLVDKAKSRIERWSDIRTLMKAKLNSDMLIQRLLNSEQ